MRFYTLIFMLLLSMSVHAQNNSLVLERMNRIKLDSDQYVYGLCTIPNNPDSTTAKKGALDDLKGQAPELPDNAVKYLCVEILPNCFRALAYVEKKELESHKQEEIVLQNNPIRDAEISRVINTLPYIRSIRELKGILEDDSIKGYVRYGESIGELSTDVLSRSFLVFYKKRSQNPFGKIVEIMSPEDSTGIRKSVLTGSSANPLDFTTSPFWVCFD